MELQRPIEKRIAKTNNRYESKKKVENKTQKTTNGENALHDSKKKKEKKRKTQDQDDMWEPFMS